jgi:hypothetical protein
MEDIYAKSYSDIGYAPMPEAIDERFGEKIFPSIQEFQVGFAGNEANPKVFRVDQQGLWLGRKIFLDPNPAFRVDMQGNVVAFSYSTALSGQRVLIQNNSIMFYDQAGVFQGQIAGTDVGGAKVLFSANETIFITAGKSVIVRGGDDVTIVVNSEIYSIASKLLDEFVFIKLMQLPQFDADPASSTLGTMYYNTVTDEVRVNKGGTWRDVLTT